MGDPALEPIVKEIQQMGWRLGIKQPPSRIAPKGAPPGGPTLSLRELHDLIRPKPARPRVMDRDLEWTAEHEAGHAVVAHGLGWRVASVEVHSRGGLTLTYPPDELEGRELGHEKAVVYAAGEAATGTQYSPGVEDDKYHVRDVGARDKLGGAVRFEDAVASATRVLNVPWCRTVHRRLVAALLEHGRLEGEALQAILGSED